MSYPRVQFVSAPSLDADVRFDCNSVGEWSDDDRWPEHDGFTLGFPTLSGDPEAIGVQYGTRQIEFNLIVRATPDAAFRAFSRLSREVQRPRNWLMVQFSDFSKPVWFYTYRTEQQALDFENVSGIDDAKRNVWGIGVRLAADPFAFGERVTLGPFTVGNKQAAANPWNVALPDIAGDAPAPVRMRVQTSTDWSGYAPMVSSIALDGGAYDGHPVLLSMQQASLSTDAAAWVADSTYPSGGYLNVTFATNPGLATRMTDITTVLPIGTYRALVFVARSDTSSTFRLKGRHFRDSITLDGDPVDFDRGTSPSSNYKTWVDLGLFTFPAFASMDDRDVAYTQTALFRVLAQRLSGTGSLRMGAVLYVPVETPWSTEARSYFGEFDSTGLLAANRTGEWDEDGNYAMLVTSSLPNRSLYDAAPPKPVGGLPVVVPGCTNTLTLVQQTNCHSPAVLTLDNSDDVNATATVTIDYAPRYLNLAGSEVL